MRFSFQIFRGARILMSVPSLVMHDAGPTLASLIGERGARTCIGSQLLWEGGDVDARLLFVPELKPAN